MKDIRLIIFDLDGTLVNAYPAIIRSFNYTMRRLKCPKQINGVIRRSVGWGDRNLLKPFLKEADLDKALSIYRRHHAQTLIKYTSVFPGARQVLSYLKKKGYKLAVASNRPTRFSNILMRHLGLQRYLDYSLCGDKVKHMKPNPEILNRIMHRLQVRPAQTLFVGDMFIDVQAGRRAGVKTIMLTTGSSTREELEKERPYRIIDKLTEIIRIISLDPPHFLV
ncbi:MAG: HAD family hydrolase [Deltaproteobacteria bacterium]